MVTQYVNAFAGARGEAHKWVVIHFAQTQRLAGNIRFVTHHGNRQIFRQSGDKVRPDLRRIGGAGGGAINHKQHAVGLLNFLPRAFNTDTLHFIVSVAQACGVDDMQRHAVDVDMLAQDVTGGAGNVGHNRGFTARQGVQQARFPGVWTTGNHDLHPFTQQAALTRFGAHRIEVGNHIVELRFDFSIGKEVDLFVREVDSRFHIDAQVSKCFHKVVNTCREGTL